MSSEDVAGFRLSPYWRAGCPGECDLCEAGRNDVPEEVLDLWIYRNAVMIREIAIQRR